MAVKNIDSVAIPGFANYALYSFSYSPGFSTEYGSVEAEFLSKDGTYDVASLELELNQHSFFSITLKTSNGVVNSLGKFVLVSYETVKSGQYKILKVRFADQSVELDRYLVALRGQVGYDSIAHNKMSVNEKARVLGVIEGQGRLIWVGESDTACKEDILDEIQQDPCDPCDAALNNGIINKIDCQVYYLMKRRRYQYSFTDLLGALNSAGIGLSFSSVAGTFEDHKFDYSGTIREVLNNICSELGLTFFYDPTNAAIVIVDVRSGISIDIKDAYTYGGGAKVLEDTYKKTKENSKDVFGVASFQREGEEKEYGCALDVCSKLRLRPFTLSDLFGDDPLKNGLHFSDDQLVVGHQDLSNVRQLEFYSMLTGRVGRAFRDMFLWNTGYEFTTAKKLEDAIGEKLIALNGMTIKRVLSPDAADPDSQYLYRILAKVETSKDYEAIKTSFDEKKYYFLAELDEVRNEQIQTVEEGICNGFLGQYWIRRFKQYWNGLGYNALAPDGSVQYYDFRDPISLPFADIVLQATGSLKNSPLLERTKGGFGDSIAEGEDPDSLRTRDTFYLLTRPAAFYPTALSKEILESIERNLIDYSFKEISMPTDLNNKLKQMEPGFDPDKHRIYSIYALGEGQEDKPTSVTVNKATHPVEKKNVVIPVNACEKSTSYGLDDADTLNFKLKFKDLEFSMMLPVQSFVLEEGDGEEGDDPHDGYTILVERTGTASKTFIPKIEVFSSGSVPASSSPKLGIEFNSYNASTNDLELLAKVGGKNVCDLDTVGIQSLLSGLAGLLNYSNGNSEERSLKLEGVPYDFYTAADGLRSINISLGGNGLSTSLSFSNSFPFKLTPDLFLKKLKYLQLKQIQQGFPNGSIPKTEGGDLPEITT